MASLTDDEGKVVVESSVEQSALSKKDAFVDALLHELHIVAVSLLAAHLA